MERLGINSFNVPINQCQIRIPVIAPWCQVFQLVVRRQRTFAGTVKKQAINCRIAPSYKRRMLVNRTVSRVVIPVGRIPVATFHPTFVRRVLLIRDRIMPMLLWCACRVIPMMLVSLKTLQMMIHLLALILCSNHVQIGRLLLSNVMFVSCSVIVVLTTIVLDLVFTNPFALHVMSVDVILNYHVIIRLVNVGCAVNWVLWILHMSIVRVVVIPCSSRLIRLVAICIKISNSRMNRNYKWKKILKSKITFGLVKIHIYKMIYLYSIYLKRMLRWTMI